MVMCVSESGNAGESGNDGSLHRNLLLNVHYHGLVHIYMLMFSALHYCPLLFFRIASLKRCFGRSKPRIGFRRNKRVSLRISQLFLEDISGSVRIHTTQAG